MKKLTLLALTLSTAAILTACNTSSAAPELEVTDTSNSKLSIVATSFHEYDWVNQIVGEDNDTFEVTLLMDTGVDLHSYEPSVEDISMITNADLYIFNGGLSQTWVYDLMEDDTNVINVMSTLGDAVKNEVTVEGMQAGSHAHEDEHDHDDHDHEDEHAHDHDHAHEEETHTDEAHAPHEDEHVWLSLNNAMDVCQVIADEVSKLDQENADVYAKNAETYISSLEELDASFETAIKEAPRDTLLFTDRFPFLYMMNDYEVEYFAAFQGCSAETEATFETIAFLSDKINELDINNLLIIDNGLVELANTVKNNSDNKDCEILTLHSMQSVSTEEISNGTSYYDIMSSNLETLKLALAE